MDPKDELALKVYGIPFDKLCLRRKTIISQLITLKKTQKNIEN